MAQHAIFGGALSLSLPDSWADHTVHTYISSDVIASRDGGEHGFTPNVVVTRAPLERVELAAHVATQLEQAAQDLPGFQLVSREETVVDGVPATVVGYTFQAPPNDLAVHVQQLYALNDGYALTLTFTTLPVSWKDHRALFHGTVASLRWK